MAERRPSAVVGIGSKQVHGLNVEQVQQSLLGLLPDHQEFVKEHLIKPFCPSDEDYENILKIFEENLNKGLCKDNHDKANVKMYPTYVRDVPDGSERGTYLALDFGGVNFRLILIKITAEGITKETKTGVIPNRMLDDTGAKLFDYIANFLHLFLKQHGMLNTSEPLHMGFGFSFAFEPVAVNRGILVRWAKHFHCAGVVGEEVVGMLEAAIKKKGDMNLEITAIINDTVGTLMAGAVEDTKCAIGLILGKGTNACYMESIDKVERWEGDCNDPKQVIIATEWRELGLDGSLDAYRSEYDLDIDEHCKHKGFAIYEKMVSTLYLGEMVRLALQKMKDNNVLFMDHWSDVLGTRWSFYAKYVSEVLSEEDIRFKHTRHVFDDMHNSSVSELECRILHHVCQLASARAASLTAIGLACLMNRMGRKEVGIAVDGSLYRFHPLFHDLLMNNIPKYLKNDTKFWFVPAADGSGMGAALTSAVVWRLEHPIPQEPTPQPPAEPMEQEKLELPQTEKS